MATTGESGEFDGLAEVIFEEKAGLVPISIRKDSNKPLWCALKAPEALSVAQTISVELVAAALSLTPEDIVTDTHMPQVASVGFPFLITELTDRAALERARVNMGAIDALTAAGITPDIHVYTHSKDDFDIRTRMFAPLDGVPEDPATGSANCALAALLTHYNKADNGAFSWRIAQGVEMKRPSVLAARTEKQDDAVTGVWIGGSSVMISEGTIEVD